MTDSRWSRATRALAVLLLLGALTGLALHYLSTSQRYVVLVTSFAHQAMWLAPIAALVAILVRAWRLVGVAVVITGLVAFVQIPPAIGDDVPAGARSLVVMQANLRLGQAEPQPIVDLVREKKVDLLSTVELTDYATRRLLDAGLGKVLPYRYLRPLRTGGSGLGIWSRYPLSRGADLPRYFLGTVKARAATPAGPVTFYAVHLTPPYAFPGRLWLGEMPRLRAQLQGEPDGPVIAAGDYNATVDHAQFRKLLQDGYADAAQQAGAGYLPSYPTDRWYGPVIAIDHVLTRGAVATSAETVDLPNSDHRGLVTTVAVP